MKLSIITITRNDLKGLRVTAESVRSQTFSDFEWLVIDGASTDGTADYLREHAEWFSYWCSEPDKGIYNGMNKGIAQAKGEYLLFLNSADALCEADTLTRVFAEPIDADVLYGDAWFLFTHKPHELFTYPDRLSLYYLHKNSINHQAAFIRRTLLAERGYDESYHIAADWKRFVELNHEGRKFVHLPFAVSLYDAQGISSVNVEDSLKERDRAFSEIYPQDINEILRELSSYDNKPCRQTRDYCEKSRLYRRLIRSTLHFCTWLENLKHH